MILNIQLNPGWSGILGHHINSVYAVDDHEYIKHQAGLSSRPV